jgi:hypothetical protein
MPAQLTPYDRPEFVSPADNHMLLLGCRSLPCDGCPLGNLKPKLKVLARMVGAFWTLVIVTKPKDSRMVATVTVLLFWLRMKSGARQTS